MRRRTFLFSLLPIAGMGIAAARAAAAQADLPSGPLAPPIRSATWINTAPLAWDSLRGRVVMVEFWTYG
jgi:hypothetical protein